MAFRSTPVVHRPAHRGGRVAGLRPDGVAGVHPDRVAGVHPDGADLAEEATLGRIDPSQAPWPGRTVVSGGVALHVRETPASSPDLPEAVYVHGLAGSSTNWTDLAGMLSRRVAGTAVDLPGFGLSEPTAQREYTPDAMADALLCWIAGRGRPVHLVGNSLGGLISMTVAARRPELVRSLTLVSPAMPDRRPDPRRLSDPRMALAMVPGLGRTARRALAEEPLRSRAEKVVRLCFADPARGSARRLEELVAEAAHRATLPWATEASDGATRGLLGAWAGRGAWVRAGRVRVPTMVIWGEQDRIVTARLARRTVAALPDARLLLLPGVGHVAQMEVPELVARATAGAWDAQEQGRWSTGAVREDCG